MDLMDLQEQIRTARETGEFAPLLDAIPYACLLGIKMQLDDQGEPLFHLPFAQKISVMPCCRPCMAASSVVFLRIAQSCT